MAAIAGNQRNLQIPNVSWTQSPTLENMSTITKVGFGIITGGLGLAGIWAVDQYNLRHAPPRAVQVFRAPPADQAGVIPDQNAWNRAQGVAGAQIQQDNSSWKGTMAKTALKTAVNVGVLFFIRNYYPGSIVGIVSTAAGLTESAISYLPVGETIRGAVCPHLLSLASLQASNMPNILPFTPVIAEGVENVLSWATTDGVNGLARMFGAFSGLGLGGLRGLIRGGIRITGAAIPAIFETTKFAAEVAKEAIPYSATLYVDPSKTSAIVVGVMAVNKALNKRTGRGIAGNVIYFGKRIGGAIAGFAHQPAPAAQAPNGNAVPQGVAAQAPNGVPPQAGGAGQMRYHAAPNGVHAAQGQN